MLHELPQPDLPETTKAQQGVVGNGLYLVPFQVDVSQVLHASNGSRDPPEFVLKAEQLPQCCLLNEDAVRDVEEVTIRQVEAHQLLEARECSRMEITDVLIVGHFQVH